MMSILVKDRICVLKRAFGMLTVVIVQLGFSKGVKRRTNANWNT